MRRTKKEIVRFYQRGATQIYDYKQHPNAYMFRDLEAKFARFSTISRITAIPSLNGLFSIVAIFIIGNVFTVK